MEDNVFDLSGFTPYTYSRSRSSSSHIDVTYLRMAIDNPKSKNKASLYLSRHISDVAAKRYGRTVNVVFDEKSRRFAITEGESLSLAMNTRSKRERAAISIGKLYGTCIDVFGRHRRVYFAAEVYDNCILLTPNGMVD